MAALLAKHSVVPTFKKTVVNNRIIDVLKKLKKKKIISENKYEDLYPVGPRPGILYGLAKIHKPIKDGAPSFRPILSAIDTPTYKLSKFLYHY